MHWKLRVSVIQLSIPVIHCTTLSQIERTFILIFELTSLSFMKKAEGENNS